MYREIAFWVFIFLGTYLIYKRLKPREHENPDGTVPKAKPTEGGSDSNPTDSTTDWEEKDILICPQCNEPNDEKYNYCQNCVHPLRE